MEWRSIDVYAKKKKKFEGFIRYGNWLLLDSLAEIILTGHGM